jgi:hypothetical protein
LADILAKSGATADELRAVDEALEQCVVYKAATPEFMGSFSIKTFSGLSMFFPYTKLYNSSEGGYVHEFALQQYYKTLKWNIATGLVE